MLGSVQLAAALPPSRPPPPVGGRDGARERFGPRPHPRTATGTRRSRRRSETESTERWQSHALAQSLEGRHNCPESLTRYYYGRCAVTAPAMAPRSRLASLAHEHAVALMLAVVAVWSALYRCALGFNFVLLGATGKCAQWAGACV